MPTLSIFVKLNALGDALTIALSEAGATELLSSPATSRYAKKVLTIWLELATLLKIAKRQQDKTATKLKIEKLFANFGFTKLPYVVDEPTYKILHAVDQVLKSAFVNPNQWRLFLQAILKTYGFNLSAADIQDGCNFLSMQLSKYYLSHSANYPQVLEELTQIEGILVVGRFEIESFNHLKYRLAERLCQFRNIIQAENNVDKKLFMQLYFNYYNHLYQRLLSSLKAPRFRYFYLIQKLKTYRLLLQEIEREEFFGFKNRPLLQHFLIEIDASFKSIQALRPTLNLQDERDHAFNENLTAFQTLLIEKLKCLKVILFDRAEHEVYLHALQVAFTKVEHAKKAAEDSLDDDQLQKLKAYVTERLTDLTVSKNWLSSIHRVAKRYKQKDVLLIEQRLNDRINEGKALMENLNNSHDRVLQDKFNASLAAAVLPLPKLIKALDACLTTQTENLNFSELLNYLMQMDALLATRDASMALHTEGPLKDKFLVALASVCDALKQKKAELLNAFKVCATSISDERSFAFYEQMKLRLQYLKQCQDFLCKPTPEKAAALEKYTEIDRLGFGFKSVDLQPNEMLSEIDKEKTSTTKDIVQLYTCLKQKTADKFLGIDHATNLFFIYLKERQQKFHLGDKAKRVLHLGINQLTSRIEFIPNLVKLLHHFLHHNVYDHFPIRHIEASMALSRYINFGLNTFKPRAKPGKPGYASSLHSLLSQLKEDLTVLFKEENYILNLATKIREQPLPMVKELLDRRLGMGNS